MPVPPLPTHAETPPEVEHLAERIVRAIAPICQHDLPNQLVVFQGLIHLLETEDEAHLSPLAREYLERMRAVTAKTLNLGRYVKDLCRVATKPGAIERIELAAFVEEIKAQARHSFAEHTLRWETSWQIAHVSGDRQGLTRALLELLGLTLALSTGKTVDVALDARAEDSAHVIHMGIRLDPASKDSLPCEPKIWEGRLEFVLARELLASVGGGLDMTIESGRGVNFLLSLPG